MSYTTEQARMRLRETLVMEEYPQDGTSEEYFIRAAFPDDAQPPEEGDRLTRLIEQFRTAAAKCRDNATHAKDYGHGSKLLGEATAFDCAADDLEPLNSTTKNPEEGDDA